MAKRWLYISTLFLLMLVTGVFWGTWFTLTRSLQNFEATEFIHIGQTIIANIAWPMRILVPLTILLMIISVFGHKNKRSARFNWGVLSLLLIISVLLITLLVLVPIDNDLKTWTAAVPSDFEIIREKWKAFHAYRTWLSLGSFACFSVFAIRTTPDHRVITHHNP